MERKFMRIIEAFVFSHYFDMPSRHDIPAVRAWIQVLLQRDFFLHVETDSVSAFLSIDFATLLIGILISQNNAVGHVLETFLVPTYLETLQVEQKRRLASKLKFCTEKKATSNYEDRLDPPLVLHFCHVGLLQTAGEMFIAFPLHIVRKVWDKSTADPRMVITASSMVRHSCFCCSILLIVVFADPDVFTQCLSWTNGLGSSYGVAVGDCRALQNIHGKASGHAQPRTIHR